MQPATSTAYGAAQFYENDFRYILEAEGRPIGHIEARGDGSTSFKDVDEEALKQAGARGGTHVIRTSKDLESVYFQFAQARADTACTGGVSSTNCATTFTDASFAKIADLPRARYSIWRVPCQNWPKLPEELRPTSYVGCTPESAVPEAKPVAESTSTKASKDAPEASNGDGDFTDASCTADAIKTQIPFDRDSVARAVRDGSTKSLSCPWTNKIGVTLNLTFGPTGCLRSVHVEEPIEDPKFRSCLFAAFSDVRVPAFAGGPVTISKHLGASAR